MQNLRARGNTGSGRVPSPLNDMDAPQGGWPWEELVSSVYVSEEVEWFCWEIPDLTAGQHALKHRDLMGASPQAASLGRAAGSLPGAEAQGMLWVRASVPTVGCSRSEL